MEQKVLEFSGGQMRAEVGGFAFLESPNALGWDGSMGYRDQLFGHPGHSRLEASDPRGKVPGLRER